MLKLTIGFSTLADRAAGIELPQGDFEFLVCVQGLAAAELPAELAALAGRARVESVPGLGVAKSRNRTIDLAAGEYLIFGDDDIRFDSQALEQAVALLDAEPEIALLLVAAKDFAGVSRKRYPTSRVRLSRFNSARAATYEMLVRVSAVRELGVRFDEDFGAGVENYLGDEYIFICDLLSRGARCEFAPIFVASHPVESSGSRWGSARDRLARARVFGRVFGGWAPLVRLGFGLRRLRELGGLANLARFVLGR